MPGDADWPLRRAWLSSYAWSWHVRRSQMDVFLVVFGLGTVAILWLLYVVYMVVRIARKRSAKRRGAKRAKSKADRPLWVLALDLAGTLWIVGTLLATGTLTPDLEGPGGCARDRYLFQHILGAAPFVVLVLYKLLRKYVQVRWANTRAPHALLSIALLIVPIVLVAAPAAALDGLWLDSRQAPTPESRGLKPLAQTERPRVLFGTAPLPMTSPVDAGRGAFGVCHTSLRWHATVDLLSLVLYGGLFVFFAVQLRRAIGAHHQVIRYCIFEATALVFYVLDALVNLGPAAVRTVPALEAFLLRLWPSRLEVPAWVLGTAPHQVVCLAVILIVLGNLAHVYVLVLKPKRMAIDPNSALGGLAAGEDTLRPASGPSYETEGLSSDDEGDSDGDEDSEDSRVLRDVNRLLAASGSVLEARGSGDSGTDGPPVLLAPPRRRSPAESLPRFELFVDALPEGAAARLDHNRGYYAARRDAAERGAAGGDGRREAPLHTADGESDKWAAGDYV